MKWSYLLNSHPDDENVLHHKSWNRRSLLSIGASVALLLLLWWVVSTGKAADDVAIFRSVVRNTVWWLASFYILTTLLQTLLRALRYQSLLKADGVRDIPAVPYMFLITIVRNMFVDMVPARIGEASYVIMLNRGYKIPVTACLSTLFISVVLDMLALAVILITIILAAMFSSSQSGLSAAQGLFVTSLIVLIAGFLIYSAVPLSRWFLSLMEKTRTGILIRLGHFLLEVGLSIQRVQQREVLSLTLIQSLGIRIFKYGGLMILFLAVTLNSYPEFYSLPWWQVIPAFISAEAGASLPLPTFMSFGTYEAGGMLAFSVLGFAAADILLLMFVIHLISQVVDYFLGGVGLITYFIVKKQG